MAGGSRAVSRARLDVPPLGQRGDDLVGLPDHPVERRALPVRRVVHAERHRGVSERGARRVGRERARGGGEHERAARRRAVEVLARAPRAAHVLRLLLRVAPREVDADAVGVDVRRRLGDQERARRRRAPDRDHELALGVEAGEPLSYEDRHSLIVVRHAISRRRRPPNRDRELALGVEAVGDSEL